MHLNLEKAKEFLTKKGLSEQEMDLWLQGHNRAEFASDFIVDGKGRPWGVRDYQRESLVSWAPRKVHCDGRDVGKTSEIEIMALWASHALSNREMLIATQCENHLYPLMNRIVRRFESNDRFRKDLVEIRRTPSWHLRFSNGFVLWGRIAGPRGVNFQGMHVDWQIVDEAQELTETSWAELYQALNGGGRRWVYGVPNGLRNTFYRMTQMGDGVEHHHWPSTLNPDYTEEKDEELARLYGGRSSAGYLHRVLGEHGSPAYGVFDLDDYCACVDEALDFEEVRLEEGDALWIPGDRTKGDYYLGCDLGYARDPSEFVIYRAEGPHFINVLRVHLSGVNYARQEEVIVELDRAYGFRGIGIDCGNNGRAIAHRLMSRGVDWCESIEAIEFGSAIDLDPLPDGSIERRPAKQFMTELLQRHLADRSIVFPRLAEREAQYASHTYRLSEAGRLVYEKGDDHIIDADRCAVLRRWIDTRDPDGVHLGVRLEGF